MRWNERKMMGEIKALVIRTWVCFFKFLIYLPKQTDNKPTRVALKLNLRRHKIFDLWRIFEGALIVGYTGKKHVAHDFFFPWVESNEMKNLSKMSAPQNACFISWMLSCKIWHAWILVFILICEPCKNEINLMLWTWSNTRSSLTIRLKHLLNSPHC